MNEFFRRIQYLLHRSSRDRELANEMDFHREMSSRDGGTHFGNTQRLREEARDAWGWTWIDRLIQDLRYALRKLLHSPGFTITAIVMLAIGIGVNVAAFGFFNLMFLQPLAVREPSTLLRFERRSPKNFASALPYPELTFFRDHTRTLSAVLGVSPARVSVEGESRQVNASFVTPNLFAELGGGTVLGRALRLDDDAPGAEPVVVLSYAFWQSHFGSSQSVAGQLIRVNDKPATIAGVAAKQFSGLSIDAPDFWIPIARHPYFIAGSGVLTDVAVDKPGVKMWGRIRDGLGASAAEDELRALAKRLREKYPTDIWENETLHSEPGGYVTGMMAGTSYGTGQPKPNRLVPATELIGTLAFLILAVTCGNLGSLLLARSVAREREISIRIAIGAGRARLTRQLFTESLLLAILGGLAGLLCGYIVLRGLMVWTSSPAWLDPMPDWRVAAFAMGTAVASAVLFGLTPALQIARQRHRATLLRRSLLGAQVAGSCILVILAGLLVRALDHAMYTNPGFDYQQVVSLSPNLSGHGYSPERAQAWLDAFRNRALGIPGISSVSFASAPPLGRRTDLVETEVEGKSLAIYVSRVSASFFQTMSIPLLAGRSLERGDGRAIVVSRALARAFWPGQAALGKEIPFGDVKYLVVGVAGDAHGTALKDPDAMEAYFFASASDMPAMSIQVKASGSPEGFVSYIGALGKSIDPTILSEVELLKVAYQRKLQSTEYSALTVGVLGGVALLLACLGIVGLVAYSVSQRIKEIGIRMALGASPANILVIVLHQLGAPVTAGLLLGVGSAAALSQLLRKELYGISNVDPLTYVAAVAIFAATAATAALLPARRALRVDPLTALRHE